MVLSQRTTGQPHLLSYERQNKGSGCVRNITQMLCLVMVAFRETCQQTAPRPLKALQLQTTRDRAPIHAVFDSLIWQQGAHEKHQD